MRNAEIADAFDELASLYELDGAVVYRVVAYRNAAKAIREAGVSVEELARAGQAEELAGVGKTIAEKIDALLEGGSIPSADKLRGRIPAGLVEITRIPGLGPKRVRVLHEQLGVTSLEELREATEAGRLADVPGFGAKAAGERDRALAADDAGAPRGALPAVPGAGRRRGDRGGPAAPRQARGAGGQRAAHGRRLQGPGRGRGHRGPRRPGEGVRGAARRSTSSTPRVRPARGP